LTQMVQAQAAATQTSAAPPNIRCGSALPTKRI
jgi:hypothetical protein